MSSRALLHSLARGNSSAKGGATTLARLPQTDREGGLIVSRSRRALVILRSMYKKVNLSEKLRLLDRPYNRP
jgi:hypothetical protein